MTRDNKSLFRSISLILLACLGISAVLVFFSVSDPEGVDGEPSLQGNWEYCIVPKGQSTGKTFLECDWKAIELSIGVPPLSFDAHGDLVLKRKFSTPEICKENESCALFIGGMYSRTRVFVNEQYLAEHLTRSDSYPLFAVVPSHLFKSNAPNSLILYTEYSDFARPGIPRGPFQFMREKSGLKWFVLMTFERVIFPLVGAFVVLVTILFSLLIMSSRVLNLPESKWFLLYAVNAFLLQISSTRLLREALPYPIAHNLHFIFRQFNDFSALVFFAHFFKATRTKGLFILGGAYVSILFALISAMLVAVVWPSMHLALHAYSIEIAKLLNGFGLSGFRSTGITFLIISFSTPFMVGGYIWSTLKAYESRKNDVASKVLFPVLSLIVAMNIHDIVVYLGIWQTHTERYFVRHFPTLLVVTMLYALWLRWLDQEKKISADIAIGRMTAQIVHDIKPSLAAMGVVLKVGDLKHDVKELLNGAYVRLEGLTKSLLAGHKQVNRPVMTGSLIPIEQIIKSAVHLVSNTTGKTIVFSHSNNCQQLKIHEENEIDLARAITNLLTNSAEAVSVSEIQKVEVLLKNENGEAVISVSDSGPGIPNEVRDDILAKRVHKSTKSNGHGIGLTQVRDYVASVGGTLEIGKSELGGALVVVRISTVQI